MTVAGVVGKGTVGSFFALAVRISDVADCAAVIVEDRVELGDGGVVTVEGVVGENSVVTGRTRGLVDAERNVGG